MSPRDLVYVGHMLDMARKAVDKTAGVSRQSYEGDENLRLALTHLVQVIGEAARHVSREFTDAHPEISWTEIIGMRHKVVHDHLGVDECLASRHRGLAKACRRAPAARAADRSMSCAAV